MKTSLVASLFLSVSLLTSSLSAYAAPSEETTYPVLTCKALEAMAKTEGEEVSALDLFKPTGKSIHYLRIHQGVHMSLKHHWDQGNEGVYSPNMSVEELDELGEGIFANEVKLTYKGKEFTYLQIQIGFGGGNSSTYLFKPAPYVSDSLTFAAVYFYDGDCEKLK
jgi:hypothetical protein